MRRSRRRTWSCAASGALLAALLTGCGVQGTSAAESVPELASTLSEIDQALAADQVSRTRRLLDELVATTIQARSSGDLDEESADRVLAAAARLSAMLPEPRPSRPTQTSTPPREPRAEDGHGDAAKRLEDARKKREEERKKLAEDRDKDDEDDEDSEGGGDGRSSGNGPDDGHGD